MATSRAWTALRLAVEHVVKERLLCVLDAHGRSGAQFAGKEVEGEQVGGPSAAAIATGRSSLAASDDGRIRRSSPAGPGPGSSGARPSTLGRPSRLKVSAL